MRRKPSILGLYFYLLAFCLLGALAPPATAAPEDPDTTVTYFYVTSDAELAAANANMVAGDVAVLSAGAYSVGIDPVNDGAPGNPITYCGLSADPTGAQVDYIDLADHVSIKWVQSNGRLQVAGVGDSLHAVTMRDTTASFTWAGDGNYASGLDVRAFRFAMVGSDANFIPVFDWIEDNTMEDSKIYLHSTSGTSNVAYLRSVRRCTFNRVRWYVRGSASLNDAQLYNHYNVCNSTFNNCLWDIYNGKTGSADNVKFGFNVRDQVGVGESEPGGFTVMQSCTLLVTSAQFSADILFSNPGTHPGTVGRNRYDSLLVIHQPASTRYGSGVYWHNPAQNDTVRWSVFVGANATPFAIDFQNDSCLIEHNTFISLSDPDAFTLYRDPFYADGQGPHMLSRSLAWSAGNPTSGVGTMVYNSFYDDEKMLESLYFSPCGDSSLAVKNKSGISRSPSAYDAAVPGSRWGDPDFLMDETKMAFVDSIVSWVFVQGKDPFQPSIESVALWSGWSNGYIGARDPTAAMPSVPRVPEHDPVMNFQATANTGDGDDEQYNFTFTALSGVPATSYDIRYRTDVPMTVCNWVTATQLAGEPAPQLPGSVEDFNISGPIPEVKEGQVYYFGVKASDDTLESALVIDTTLAVAIRPARPDSVVMSALSENDARVSFNAVGDDSLSGGAPASYHYAYNLYGPVTDANWNTLATLTAPNTPLGYGEVDSLMVAGLLAGRTYWFGVRAQDDIGLLSAVSDTASVTMLGIADTLAPGRVTSLVATPLDPQSARLSWLAPGDDDSIGTAVSYDMRYRTDGPVYDANFASSSQVAVEPTPSEAGAPDSVTISGLTPGTTYWFALRAQDEVPNLSALSTVATIKTTIDLAAGLVAHYPFDGSAADASGNGHDGQVAGATLVADRFGAAEAAYYFDGDDGITVPDDLALNFNDALTVSAWIRPDSLGGADRMIIGKAGLGSDTNFLVRTTSDSTLHWEYDLEGSAAMNSLPPGQWHHIVMAADTPKGPQHVYIDGTEQVITLPGLSAFGPVPDPMTIGWASNGTEYFMGAIDDIRLYDRMLTGPEVLALFNGGELPTLDAPLELPRTLQLRVFPNPSRGGATLEYALAQAGEVEVDIFNVAGQRVRTLIRGLRPAGRHRVKWGGNDKSGSTVAPGVYFARVRAGGATVTVRLVRVR